MEEKPVKPEESECCGSGCKPCIFDIYEEKLKKWENGQLENDGSSCLDEIKLSPFAVIRIERLVDSLIFFKFQSVILKEDQSAEKVLKNAELGADYDIRKTPVRINSGEYLMLRGTDDDSTFSRAYTPIFKKQEFDQGIFTIAVSLVNNGKMSTFLTGLMTGYIVYWRGPYKEFLYRRNSFRSLLMIGGGTGVVPLYNISKTIVEDDDEETRISLLCTFKTIHHFILRQELNQLRDYWNFRLQIFISTPDVVNKFTCKYGESITVGKIEEGTISEELSKCSIDETFVLVSGPPPFNQAMETYLGNLGIKTDNIFIFRYFLRFFSYSSHHDKSSSKKIY